MPIHVARPLKRIGQEEFASLDYRVMQHVFACHREMGRLCDEEIYTHDLAARLQAAGFLGVRTEVPAGVVHEDFCKQYYLDLVVEDSVIYELKVAAQLIPEQEAQLLHYLFLHGVSRGKLINFRSERVQWRFVNTGLTCETRHIVHPDTSRWKELDPGSAQLRSTLLRLLGDWGAFLELPLYVEALTHFLGGDGIVASIPLSRNGKFLGHQKFRLLSLEIAFRITGLEEPEARTYEIHLRSLLSHTRLRALQWINILHHKVSFITLENESLPKH